MRVAARFSSMADLCGRLRESPEDTRGALVESGQARHAWSAPPACVGRAVGHALLSDLGDKVEDARPPKKPRKLTKITA